MRLLQADLAVQTIEDQTIVLNLRRSQYLSVNSSGTFLLSLLNEDRSEQELVDRLAAEYAISPDTALADVKRFVDALRELGLLQEHS